MKKNSNILSSFISRRQFLKTSLQLGTAAAVGAVLPEIARSKPKSSFQQLFTLDGFVDPYGVSVGPSGRIYVTDAGGYTVKIFDKTGKFIRAFGEPGSSGAKFNYPQGIFIDSEGILYIVDSNNGRVAIFSAEGEYVTSFGSIGGYPDAFYTPKGIFVNDRLYVCNTRNHAVAVYDKRSFQLLASYGDLGDDPSNLQPGSIDYRFRLPTDVVVNRQGNILVVDSKHGEIKVLDNQGRFLHKIGTIGNDNGQLNLPEGITLDSEQNIYVCDTMNNRIQLFDTRGYYVASIEKKFKRPTSICIDSENKIYVVDSELRQVVIFKWSI